jgi:hypothetical protein
MSARPDHPPAECTPICDVALSLESNLNAVEIICMHHCRHAFAHHGVAAWAFGVYGSNPRGQQTPRLGDLTTLCAGRPW